MFGQSSRLNEIINVNGVARNTRKLVRNSREIATKPVTTLERTRRGFCFMSFPLFVFDPPLLSLLSLLVQLNGQENFHLDED